MIEEIIKFENIIKEHQSVFFDKVWEKHENNYKLIYNIQVFVKDGILYPNLKIIFWLNSEKSTLTENVITFLYKQHCDYRTENITTIEETFNNILNFINKENTNIFLREIILDGSLKINEIIEKENINNFCQTINFIPHGNVSCVMTMFKFDVVMNTDTYSILLKCKDDNKWELIIGEKSTIVDNKNVYKKIIELIDGIE